MDSTDFRRNVALSIQRALWDLVTPALRGVALTSSYPNIGGRFIYDRVPTEVDLEDLSLAVRRIVAGFQSDVHVNLEACYVPVSQSRDLLLDEWWAFRRKEDSEVGSLGNRGMGELDNECLTRLMELHEGADSEPWVAMVEGRDHVAGDSFLMVGAAPERREDMYVTRDSGPASAAVLDLIAAARTYLPALVSEILHLRSGRDGTAGP